MNQRRKASQDRATNSNLTDMGWAAARLCAVTRGEPLGGLMSSSEEATVKACGVTVAKLHPRLLLGMLAHAEGKRSFAIERLELAIPWTGLCWRAGTAMLRTGPDGTQRDAEAVRHEVTAVLAPMGLRLSEEKTRVVHIDEGFDFLGWRIQRRRRRGQNGKTAVYTYPSKKALASVMAKVRSLTARAKHRTLGDLMRSLNRVQRGWCNYFRHGVSSRTFSYLDHFAWWRVFGWLRKRHSRLSKGMFVRHRLSNWEMRDDRVELFRPQEVAIIRYRYRGARIPTP